jgi:hypothetical protein
MTHARPGPVLLLLKQGFITEKTEGPEGQRFFVLMVLACAQNARQWVKINCIKPSFDTRDAKQFAFISLSNPLGFSFARRFVAATNARSRVDQSSLALRPSGLLSGESFRVANQGPIQGRKSVQTGK